MADEKTPSERQEQFFKDHILDEDGTILTLKHTATAARGFAINIRGPFDLVRYALEGGAETVIDATWAGPPESNSHMHCCWTEVRFARLVQTSGAVRTNIGYQYQVSFFASEADAGKANDAGRLFLFYLKDASHKGVKTLTEGTLVALD